MYSLYLNYFKFVSLINLNETDTPRVFMGALNPFDKKRPISKCTETTISISHIKKFRHPVMNTPKCRGSNLSLLSRNQSSILSTPPMSWKVTAPEVTYPRHLLVFFFHCVIAVNPDMIKICLRVPRLNPEGSVTARRTLYSIHSYISYGLFSPEHA